MNSLAVGKSSFGKENVLRSLAPLMLIGVLLLAAGLRFHNLDAQSFWNDEGNSARLSERALPLILEGTASDIHPPLYYIILRGWRELVGDSEFGLRSFSAFAGVLTVAATAAVSRKLFRSSVQPSRARQGVLIAALFAALNPTLIYYSQETRMYALLALLSVLSTLALLRWLDASPRWTWATAYILLSTAGLYTHYFYPALFVFQGAIVLLWVIRKQSIVASAPRQTTADPHWVSIPLGWLLMVVSSVLLYAPWLPTFIRQTGGRAAERAPLPEFLWDSLRWMLFGETITDGDLIWVTVAAILCLLLAIIAAGRQVVIPFLGVAVLVTAMIAAGTTNPAFFKFMLTAVPFLLLWLVSSVASGRGSDSSYKRLIRITSVILLIPILYGMILSVNNLFNDLDYARDDYRGISAAIAADDHPTAAVILNAPNQWEVFTYYHRQGAPVFPMPMGQPDPSILEPKLSDIADSHDRLYVLYWGDEQQDPHHVVENWLDTNTFKAVETWVGDVRFVIYAVPADVVQDRQTSNASFGQKIALQAFTVAETMVRPGDIIPVTLYWTTDTPMQERYKVFLHVVDRDGQLVAQQDSEPVGGMSPTSSWQPGEIITDNQGVLLPQSLTPGGYRLLLGWYPVGEPENRLKIEDDSPAGDMLELGTIIVE